MPGVSRGIDLPILSLRCLSADATFRCRGVDRHGTAAAWPKRREKRPAKRLQAGRRLAVGASRTPGRAAGPGRRGTGPPPGPAARRFPGQGLGQAALAGVAPGVGDHKDQARGRLRRAGRRRDGRLVGVGPRNSVRGRTRRPMPASASASAAGRPRRGARPGWTGRSGGRAGAVGPKAVTARSAICRARAAWAGLAAGWRPWGRACQGAASSRP